MNQSSHQGAAPAPASHALWRGFARGVRDNMAAELATQTVRVGAMVILARALEPRNFGVFRVLLVISMLVSLCNDAGICDALIQRAELRPEHAATAWWLSLGLSAACAGAMYAGAPLVARWMAMPELVLGMRLLCLPQMLEGSLITANARLQRELRFGVLALAEVLAEVAFLATALTMLVWGHTAACLPAALAMRMVVHAATVWSLAGPPTIARPQTAAVRDFGGFAATVLGGRVVFLFSNNADYLIVGRLLGSTALGFYSIAWDLLRFIPDRLYKIAGRVALPAFCKLQHDDEGLGRAYLQFFGYIARVVLPLMGCVVVAAPELVGAIYGAKWLPAALPLRLLAAGLMLAGLTVGIGPVYYTKGRPGLDLYLHGLRLLLVVTVCVAFARFGLRAVSASMGVVEGLIGVAGCWMAAALIGLGMTRVLRAAAAGMRLALMCAGGALASKWLLDAAGLSGPAALPLIGLIPAALFCWSEAGQLMDMIAARAPRPAPSPSTQGA